MLHDPEIFRKPTTCACAAHSWLSLTKGFVSIIDPEMAPVVGAWKWFAKYDARHRISVARTEHYRLGGKKRSYTVYLANILLPLPAGVLVDHVNNNPLDNRRSNLRAATPSDNKVNGKISVQGLTSSYRGVFYQRGRWRARIVKNRKMVHLGTFGTEEDAAMAYDSAARSLHGDFAKLNLISESA